MCDRMDLYADDLLNLFIVTAENEDYAQLRKWDEDGSKTKAAKAAVQNLRTHTAGFMKRTAEQEEASKRRAESEKKLQKNKSLADELEKLKVKFNALVLEKNPQKRGYSLEKFLYELFLLYELEPKGPYKLEGEQIDGAFTFQNCDYLLEAKWKRQVDRGELASFCVKVEQKLKTTMGLMITIEGLTAEAISPYFKSIIIMDGADLVCVLEGRISLVDLLFKKRRLASETGNIYANFHQL